jgi:hypothetical protein
MSPIYAISRRIVQGTIRRVKKPTGDIIIPGVLVGVVGIGFSAHQHEWSWETLRSNVWEVVIAPSLLTLCLLLIWQIIRSWWETYAHERRPFRNALGSISRSFPLWEFQWRSYLAVLLILVFPVGLFCFILKKSPTIFTSPSFVVDEHTNFFLPDPHVLSGLPTAPTDHAPSLAELFTQDFPQDLKAQNNLTMKGVDLPLKEQVYLDFQGKSKFVGFYVPLGNLSQGNESAARICKAFAGQVQPMMNLLEKNAGLGGGWDMENMRLLPELIFTKLAVIYHESVLTTLQKADVIKAFKDKGIDVDFRGPAYAMERVAEWQQNHRK